MQTVPLAAAPSQTLDVALGGQPCTINCYAKNTGLFLDLLVNGALVVAGVICLNRVLIVRSKYLGFIGDLAFVDMQGSDDPVYTGLGSRFQLIYLEATDLA